MRRFVTGHIIKATPEWRISSSRLTSRPDLDTCSRETPQRPYIRGTKRRAVRVEVSADHITALGRCSRMEGLTKAEAKGGHMELHSCVSASISVQLFARNVSRMRVQEPKRRRFPAPSIRTRPATNSPNARGAIEAEPWRATVDRHSPVDHQISCERGLYIDCPPEDLSEQSTNIQVVRQDENTIVIYNTHCTQL